MNYNALDVNIRANEEYSLFKNMLPQELLYDNNGYIIHDYFYKFSTLLIDLKKFDEARKFINKFRYKLHVSFQKDCPYVVSFLLLVEEKKFDKALEQLYGIKITDKEYLLFVKQKKLICNYELGNIENLEKEIESCIIFTKRYEKYVNKNLFNHINKFLRHFLRFCLLYKDLTNLKALEKELVNSDRFTNKKWLLSKIKESMSEIT